MMRSACAVLLAALTVGCSGGGAVHSIHHTSEYEPADFGYYNAEQGMRVIVLNNPTDVAMAEFAGALTRAMDGRNIGTPIRFTADPASPAGDETRVIISFAPDRSRTPGALCREPSPEARPDPGRDGSEMLMVYCKYDRLQSTVTASASLPEPVGGPAFNAYVGQATHLLLGEAVNRRQIGDN